MPTFHDLTTAQLKQAVQIREQIESLQEKLDTLLGGAGPVAKAKQIPGQPKARRKFSAATIEKMRAAQRARYAKLKGSPAKAPVQMVAKKKGGITAAGRAKLAAAMKARWAARKKGAPASNASA